MDQFHPDDLPVFLDAMREAVSEIRILHAHATVEGARYKTLKTVTDAANAKKQSGNRPRGRTRT